MLLLWTTKKRSGGLENLDSEIEDSIKFDSKGHNPSMTLLLTGVQDTVFVHIFPLRLNISYCPNKAVE